MFRFAKRFDQAGELLAMAAILIGGAILTGFGSLL